MQSYVPSSTLQTNLSTTSNSQIRMILPSEIWSIIFDFSDVQDIFQISRTCRLIHTKTKQYWSSKLKCARLLQPFCDSEAQIDDIINMLSVTGAIISGSAALQLFERTCFNDDKMNIYVKKDQYKNAETVLNLSGFVKNDENLEESLKSMVEDNYPFIDKIDKMQTLTKANANKIIHLIGTRRSPVLAILKYHCSKHLTQNI